MQRVTLGIGDAFGPVETAMKETFVPELFEGLGDGVLEIGVTPCQSNRQDWPFLSHPRRPLITGRRPVSSQDTSLQHSGARWSSGRRTTRPASGRDGRRFYKEDSGEKRRHCRPH